MSSIFDGQTLLAIVFAYALYFVIKRYVQFREAARGMGNHPGWRKLIDQASVLSNILPPLIGITVGKNHHWENGFKVFDDFGWDIHTSVGFVTPIPTIHVASPSVVKEIVSNRSKFPKPLELYSLLNYYGVNIVTTEGEQWKTHRKITSAAFVEKNNSVVWGETTRVIQDLLDNVWGDEKEIHLSNAVDLTIPMTLYIISAAEFGQKISFTSSEDEELPSGHKMSFKEAIHLVSTHLLFLGILPLWTWSFTKEMRKVKLAFTELYNYMSELISNPQDKIDQHTDLLSSLLAANEDEIADGGTKLSESELIGNVFMFLVAGHETTAHTTVWALALLALYPEEQDKLYKHIMAVMGSKPRYPTYDEMPQLSYVVAVIYETLRLFPAVPGIPKTAEHDTTLTATNTKTGETTQVPCPKDTLVMITVPALHKNPRYWEDPEEFRPERFMKSDWPRDAFLPFNGGPRACLGRKFAETEMTAILAQLISRYSVHLTPDPLNPIETWEESRRRISKAAPGLTHTPTKVPLTFRRREY